MTKPVFRVDFNEMLEPDLVLLAKDDARLDLDGNEVLLAEGMAVAIFEEDADHDGRLDNLIASGVVERNRSTGWGAHVKWCCRIDADGIRHQSDDARRAQ